MTYLCTYAESHCVVVFSIPAFAVESAVDAADWDWVVRIPCDCSKRPFLHVEMLGEFGDFNLLPEPTAEYRALEPTITKQKDCSWQR